MSDRLLQFLLIDPDPIFRLGLKVTLETIPNLQVIADVATDTAALQVLAEILAENPQKIQLIILELDNEPLGLQFCRQLKALYPHIPILLLSSKSQPELLIAAKATGISGYCPKGISISELVPILRAVANGGYYWFADSVIVNSSSSPLAFFKLRNNLQTSGINYIDQTLNQVTEQLEIPGITILNKAILAGQRRELLAARWVVNHLLVAPQEIPKPSTKNQLSSLNIPPSRAIIKLDPQPLINIPPVVSSQQLQSELLSLFLNKLQFSLENITNTPLEIDILRDNKKRELFYIIVNKFFKQVDEIRSFKFDETQLFKLKDQVLVDLWQFTITEFFGNYAQISLDKEEINLVRFLLDKTTDLQTEIVNNVPLLFELLSYLVLSTDLYIDNISYPAGTKEAQTQALSILENFLIHIANTVIQPLLNNLADQENIKQNFYHRQIISTREIEKFRNNLSWKYQLNKYVTEAQTIFESRYELFIFAPRGIAKISIYAPRNQELFQLSGIPLGVTLMLEFRDAISPRIQSLVGFLGTGIVFVLTQVIGRGLGLVGRGILQGIGSVSFTEKGQRKNQK
jgi:DNA-binding NarL/FixJ family response regulator